MSLWRWVAVSVLPTMAACDAVCPAQHDPSANPVGLPCDTDVDCRVECVCHDPNDGGEVGVLAGSCEQGACADADLACRPACGLREYRGEYCETRD